MRAKTMEGLVGARTNIELMNTPMRVYREARRRGDTAVMERAMEYAGKSCDQAKTYQEQAKEGMKEDLEDAKKKEESDRLKAIEKRREESRKLEKRIEKSREEKQDTAVVSEEGKALLEKHLGRESVDVENASVERKEPVIYTKAGETEQAEQHVNLSVSM